MGGCCSSEPQTIDQSRAPEKVPIKDRDSVKEKATGSKGAESGESIEDQWKRAIEENDNKRIKHLFKEHHKTTKFLKIKFENGDNSLHTAIRANNSRLAKFLIILKMNVNEKNASNGNTALHYAVMSDNPQMVKVLTKNDKTKKNIENNEGKTAVDIAIEKQNAKIMKLLKIGVGDDDVGGISIMSDGAGMSDYEEMAQEVRDEEAQAINSGNT